jgi:hypothetical protein
VSAYLSEGFFFHPLKGDDAQPAHDHRNEPEFMTAGFIYGRDEPTVMLRSLRTVGVGALPDAEHLPPLKAKNRLNPMN